MRGRIDRYSHQSQRGIIRGEDGSDYPFSQDQWEAHGLPMPGMGVEFDAQGPTATNIRLLSGTMWSWLSAGPGQRSRTIAGLLAIFFGCVGAHKIYMGKPAVGILHLILLGAGVFFWVVPNVILWDSPGAAFLICLLGWVAMFGIYFAGRRYVFGHSTQAILMPLRFLRWPFYLFRWPRKLMRNNQGGTGMAFILDMLGIALFVSLAILIAFLFYLLIMHIGFFMIASSVGIGVAEGMVYVRKTDAEFDNVYFEGGRSWF